MVRLGKVLFTLGRVGQARQLEPEALEWSRGVDDPYDKLKRVLRAEIDESAWSTLYTTKSRLFDKPEMGKIAVKVINHYRDEVLKVFEVQ